MAYYSHEIAAIIALLRSEKITLEVPNLEYFPAPLPEAGTVGFKLFMAWLASMK